ncbi:MAG: lysophospholipid acyltransferase family protein [Bacteroidota bacterium]
MENSQNVGRAYAGHNFTYVSPHDPFYKRWVISAIEKITGKDYLQNIYNQLHDEDPTPWNVWANALGKLNIKIDYDQGKLDMVPKTGPVIFVANHPYGVVDGAIFCHLVTRVRKDFFLLVNEVLSREPIMKHHLLPVDFRNNDEALATNLKTKELTTKRLNDGEALVIFPSGAVATAMKFFGKVEEFPWRKFITSRIHETKCTVVPMFFHGTNSRLFQFVSKISMNLRLGLLLHEVMNKRGKTIEVEIGAPITYNEMEKYEDRQELIDFLRGKTMSLETINK